MSIFDFRKNIFFLLPEVFFFLKIKTYLTDKKSLDLKETGSGGQMLKNNILLLFLFFLRNTQNPGLSF